MKYTEHKELAEGLRARAREALAESVRAAERICELDDEAATYHRDGAHERYVEWHRCLEVRDSRYAEYVRLSKLADRHMGIYRSHDTRIRNRRAAALGL